MNQYNRWLFGDRCCGNSHSTILPDCDGKDCSCEAIYLELDNLKTDVIKISGDTDLSNYYTKAEVDALIPSLSGYATEEWVINQGYLTEHTPLKTINGQVISGSGNIVIEGSGTSVTVDDSLSLVSTNPVQNKVVTEALNNKLDASAYTPTDLSNYYNKQEVNNLIPTSNSGLTNDAHYITSGDSVFNNYATTANTYTKTEVNNLVNNKFWCGTQQEYDAIVNKEPNVLYLIHE